MATEMEQTVTPLTQMKAANKIEQDTMDKLQDLYCELRAKLDPKLAAIKIEQNEVDAVEEQLLAHLDTNYPIDKGLVRKTQQWLLEAGFKGKATEITDKKGIIAILGLDTYLELSSISITDLKKYLTPPQVAKVSKEVHKNKRRIKYAKQ